MNPSNENNTFAEGQDELPVLPPVGSLGPDVCTVIRTYLAIWRDLTAAQRQAVSLHLPICPDCARDWQVMQRTTELVASLDASQPSAHVDQAVFDAIAQRVRTREPRSLQHARQQRKRRRAFPVTGWIAAAAVLVLGLLGCVYLALGGALQGSAQALNLPANLAWNSYVLYHTQSMMSSQGEHYQVMSYHDLSDNSMNVETVVPGKMDIVVVKDQQHSLGLDMMHHVAQWDVSDDDDDDATLFNLTALRQELHDGQAAYLGKKRYQNQDVYSIRRSGDVVMLLNMQYMPINVLENASSPTTGTPMYTALRWLIPSQVAPSTWDMSVPQGFTMGTLPPMP